MVQFTSVWLWWTMKTMIPTWYCCTLLRNSTSRLILRLIIISSLLLYYRLLSDAPFFSTIVDRAFSFATSRLCNTLPHNVTSASSISAFRQLLKTHLFDRSFPKSHGVPLQLLCHFGHYNQSFYLLTWRVVEFIGAASGHGSSPNQSQPT